MKNEKIILELKIEDYININKKEIPVNISS